MEALSYIGTRFSHQGRNPGRRLDCAGIPVCAYRAAGVPVEDFRAYTLPPADGLLREWLGRNLGAPHSSGRVGDVALIQLGRGEIHCAVVVSDREMVHVMPGRSVSRISRSSVWGRRVTAYYGVAA